LLENAIEVFAQVFNSDRLNEKNKLQLLKHFVAHSAPPVPPTVKDKKKLSIKEAIGNIGDLKKIKEAPVAAPEVFTL